MRSDALDEPTTDAQHLRRVFGAFPTGVTAVAALIDGRPVGLAASSFTSVSLDPPLVSVCVAHTSSTWPVMRDAGRFGLSVLSSGQVAETRALSAKTDRPHERFATLSWRHTAHGAVLIDGAAAWLECSIHARIRAGDHDLLLLRVHDLDADPDAAPLVFHASTFRRLER